MNLRELEAQAEFLAPVIAAAVKSAVQPLRDTLAEKDRQIADLIKRFEELPSPEPIDLEAIAKRVQLPEVRNGKDADPVDLDALAKAAAALVVLPEVKDGKDAEVDLEALAKAAAALVVVPEPIAPDLEAIAALVKLPEVKDGKDADPVDLEAVAALVKVPEAEKVDVDAIARAAAAMVPIPEVRQPQDGRDALHLEILPLIDGAKTYARGTYAKHDGGLWRSFEQTSGMRGWECIVEGLKSVSVAQTGDREFSVTLAKSSGAEVVQKIAMPIQIYKGVHRDGEAYDQHDNVTWAGSQWTSVKSENVDKPGSSDSWTLVVKAGRNGKDLRENASTFDVSKGVSIR
ncbi:phage portal protein [Pseudomonas tolaasii]